MTIKSEILNFYSCPAAMTVTGKHSALLRELPNEVAELTRIIQGLVLYEYVAPDFYNFVIPDNRRTETHLRTVEQMLDCLLAINSQPLWAARSVDQRLVGVCHHFALLLVALLRAKGIPARYRCGFGTYFNPPYLEEHVVCEYWNATEAHWVLVDPQFDQVWREQLNIEHDILDVPRDRFIIAGDAWVQCRTGKLDPEKIGIFKGNLRGLWFTAGEIVRDVAALNKVEMLPWDIWGAIPGVDEILNDDQLAFFDQLAELTRLPETFFTELLQRYTSDCRLGVSSTVFNGLLNRLEMV
jgi:Transglutaminase-like superfamily